MSSKKREIQRRLMKQYHISFEGPIDSLDHNRLPQSHVTTFDHIRVLGATKLEQYRENVTVDHVQRPWRGQLSRRAERVASVARSCLEGRKNEAGWRLALESEILIRLTIEVACRTCCGRLWRSEVEVEPSQREESSGERLKDRQLRRKPCQCRNGEVLHEQGLNPLFDDRADEAIVHEAQLQSELPNREERPDRIYGLRTTKRLDRLLMFTKDKRPSASGKLLCDSLQTTPFRSNGEPIVFPFLVVEAKSEKSANGFMDIQIQTAFAIRELLILQDGLRKAADMGKNSEFEPFVWFLSYKGEQWRVSAAYIEEASSGPRYRILTLWTGGVDSKCAALQLLLIVDYIFDWARDIYREAIIHGLRSLAETDSRSLAYDSDIHSMAAKIEAWPTGNEANNPIDLTGGEDAAQDTLRSLDSEHGVLRDIRFIRSRVSAIYITEDNFQVLLDLAKTPQEKKRLAASLLLSLRRSWRVHRSALDSIELGWTGRDRDSPELYSPDKSFLFAAAMVNYISEDWEQTRELCYVAVAETLVKPLLDLADFTVDSSYSPRYFPFVDAETLRGTLGGTFLKSTAIDNLAACVTRACLSTTFVSYHRDGVRVQTEGYWVSSAEMTNSGITYRLDTVLIPSYSCGVYDIVHGLYNRDRIDINERTFSPFRTSTRLDRQLVIQPTSLSAAESLTESPWPRNQAKLRDLAGAKFLLAFCSKVNAFTQLESSDICIFITTSTTSSEMLKPNTISQLAIGLKGVLRVVRLTNEGSIRLSSEWNVSQCIARDDHIGTKARNLIRNLRERCQTPEQHNAVLIQRSPHIKKTWISRRKFRRKKLVTLDGTKFSFEDAERFAETRTRQVSSVTWENPPKDGTISSSSLAVEASRRGLSRISKAQRNSQDDIKAEESDVNFQDIDLHSDQDGLSSLLDTDEDSDLGSLLSYESSDESEAGDGHDHADDGDSRAPPLGRPVTLYKFKNLKRKR